MTEHAPRATYRLQLGPDLDFAAAADMVDLAADLGVSHLYLSPITEAVAGSTHGYDVADPTRISDALGGEAGLRALAERASGAGLGLVVDAVPNHMAADTRNPHWARMLEVGTAGADVFDVDWQPPLPHLRQRVILPVLGDRYGAVLERGELQVVDDGDAPALAYYDNRWPLSPDTVEAIRRAGGPAAFAGTPGDPRSFDRLHALIEAQHYRLVHWRVGDRIINYRRFFTINDLAAVRVEDPPVFDLVHDRLLDLVADGTVHGLRIDHPDGLRDPGRYFTRLAERSGGAWTVAEKITHPGEPLPDWPVAGTTGYDFCNDVLGVLAVDPAAADDLAALDAALGGGGSYEDAAAQGKREMLNEGLAADTDRVARLLWTVTQDDRWARDIDLASCRRAVVELAVGIDVYRTYVDPVTGEARPADRAVLARARARAGRSAAVADWLLDFTVAALLGDRGTSPVHLDLIARFPQLTAAAVAKGTEDTAFYRYRRLLALNEVGGDPARFGLDVPGFHETNSRRAAEHPAAMLTTATHDTKRGEDTRLRMAALSEIPRRWAAFASRWVDEAPQPMDRQAASLGLQTMVGVWPLSAEAPSAGGAWRDRVVAYLVKAEREAAQRTLWTDPDAAFEEALAAFVDSLLDDASFVQDMGALTDRTSELAMVTGLSQTLLRCTVPGVPDTYQGMEIWDDHLVDPDNRRPVDWTARRRVLEGLDGADPSELWRHRRDGRVKAFVLRQALRLRAARPRLFGAEAGYTPRTASGERSDHVVAFSRGADDDALVVVATRLPNGVSGDGDGDGVDVEEQGSGPDWRATRVDLPATQLVDVLTGRRVPADGSAAVADLLDPLPVALLTGPSD